MEPLVSNTPLSVLIVEDDNSLRTAVRLNLENAGYKVQEADNGETALSLFSSRTFDLVICDLNMPGMDGITFITQCRERNPDPAIVLITAYGDSELVLKAMRAGAYDHLAKPFTGEELILTLRKIEERENLKTENEALKRALTQRYNFSSIVAKSKAMEEIFETVKRLSQFATTVLITGESGTGKELIAQAIHQNSSRKGAPFVAINCGAIPENLIESELFGHKKGAFTDATKDKKGLFEEADNGTLFLDEIGELPLHLQVKLLRALQEQQIRRVGDELVIPINVRVIAATLRDLEEDVKDGRFRDDLYYLYDKHTVFNRNFRIMVENKYIELQNRVLQNISSTGQERYEAFLEQYPVLSNRLSNTQIASYLGITPEFLSKIRADRKLK